MHKDNLQTNYRMELPAKIMHVAMREFRRCGVKAVKMDDIASRLSISKRTLYEIFSNKEELLLDCRMAFLWCLGEINASLGITDTRDGLLIR